MTYKINKNIIYILLTHNVLSTPDKKENSTKSSLFNSSKRCLSKTD